MNWKKNAFSYFVWFVYTIMTGAVLLSSASGICASAGLDDYMEIVLAVGCMAAVGGMAFLLHRFALGRAAFTEEKRVHLTVLAALLAMAFLGAGLFLRVRGIDGAEHSSSVYYEAAKVMEGQKVPQSVHGAVYFYVQLLHVVFRLVGNHPVAGIWMQIVLQLTASLLLFFLVRRLAGLVASLVVLGFCMCAPFMVRSALALSPEMLYFLLLTAALSLVAAGYGDRGREGETVCGLNLKICFFTGALAALCCYMDILGAFLLLAAIGGVFCHREEAVSAGRKAAGVLLNIAGAMAALGACVFLDASLSGKSFQRVAAAWLSLYRPEAFQLPVGAGGGVSLTENCLLFGIMAFGIFSFWFDKKRERISIAVLAVCGILAAGCYGIFTEEMPGFFYLYVAAVVLAGIGFGQCFYAEPAKEAAPAEEEKPDWEILIDSREAAEQKRMQKETEREEKPDGHLSQEPQVQFLENPLPLPKKHVKRVLDYSLPPAEKEDDFDYPVAENDDFDI